MSHFLGAKHPLREADANFYPPPFQVLWRTVERIFPRKEVEQSMVPQGG